MICQLQRNKPKETLVTRLISIALVSQDILHCREKKIGRVKENERQI